MGQWSTVVLLFFNWRPSASQTITSELMAICVSDSSPVITPNARNICLLQGQDITLTCRVTYNGTNLMPLTLQWQTVDRFGYIIGLLSSSATVNVSSVYESSLTFTTVGHTSKSYRCRTVFSSPTGVAVPGVYEQDSTAPSRHWAATFASRKIASAYLNISYPILFFKFAMCTA